MRLPWHRRSPTGTFVRSSAVKAVRHGDRTVLLDLTSERYFSLDGVAGRIWDLLTEPLSLATLSTAIASEYDAPLATVETDVAELLAGLSAEGLVRAG